MTHRDFFTCSEARQPASNSPYAAVPPTRHLKPTPNPRVARLRIAMFFRAQDDTGGLSLDSSYSRPISNAAINVTTAPIPMPWLHRARIRVPMAKQLRRFWRKTAGRRQSFVKECSFRRMRGRTLGRLRVTHRRIRGGSKARRALASASGRDLATAGPANTGIQRLRCSKPSARRYMAQSMVSAAVRPRTCCPRPLRCRTKRSRCAGWFRSSWQSTRCLTRPFMMRRGFAPSSAALSLARAVRYPDSGRPCRRRSGR
jgi:hypothetical protein